MFHAIEMMSTCRPDALQKQVGICKNSSHTSDVVSASGHETGFEYYTGGVVGWVPYLVESRKGEQPVTLFDLS